MKNIIKILNSINSKPKEDILKFLKTLNIMELDQLALTEKIPLVCFNYLKNCLHPDIQQSLAVNETTPKKILKEIYNKTNQPKVLKSLAENPQIDQKILFSLIKNRNYVTHVCKNKSINDKLALNILELYPNDKIILQDLLTNSMISNIVLKKIIDHIYKISSIFDDSQSTIYYYLIKALLAHPKIQHDDIKMLLRNDKSKDNIVKKNIASFYPKIRKKLYLEFLKEKDLTILKCMVFNKATPSWVLFYLSKDFPTEVKLHPNYKDEALEILKMIN